MRRDTIFYQLFRQSPALLFDLISYPPQNANEYIFDSIEVKETAFRIDGVFIPPDPSEIVYFCEVQFQPDELLYERMLSEISIYTYRHRNSFSDWRAVAIYPSRSLEQANKSVVAEMLASGRIIPIYLDELATGEDLPTGLSLMLLTLLEGDSAVVKARQMIQQSRPLQDGRVIMDLISTIMVYKFNNLTRDEVDAMLGIQLEQTRVYQDARAEGRTEGETIGEARGEVKGLERGRTEGEQILVLKQLTRKLGNINPEIRARVNSLKIGQIESLGEDLLDFTQMSDFLAWLDTRSA
jgi:predicted transposase/invertase (TIGR01784 family)